MLARTLNIAASLLLLVIAAMPARAEPIANYEAMPVAQAGRQPLPLQQVRDAIVAAGKFREWKFADAGPGSLVGTLSVRGMHLIEVGITYSPERYSVVYRSSLNMRYDATDNTIHRNYNAWVKELIDRINVELGSLTPGQATPALASAPPAIVSPPAPPIAVVSVAAGSASGAFPQVGDSWTYRLTYRKRWGELPRNPSMQIYTVKVGSASESEIVDQLSIDGASPIDTKHIKGGYLVAQGVSVFSPYLPMFESGSSNFPLGRIQILDTACRGMFLCEVKGRVVGPETVSVGAGKFAAIKVVVDHAWRPSAGASANQNQMAQLNGGRTLTIWYAPEVKRAVKFSSRPTVGDVPPVETNFDLELLSYQLK